MTATIVGGVDESVSKAIILQYRQTLDTDPVEYTSQAINESDESDAAVRTISLGLQQEG